jgi:hypothetical protein
VAVSSGVVVAEGDGDSLGAGVGDPFLRFRFVSGVGLGDGVGEIFFFFGEAVGDGLGVADRFRCFRAGVGVGVASKTFLIFAPNDSSAACKTSIALDNSAAIRNARSSILIAGGKINARVREESICLGEYRLQDSREGNSR